MRVRPFHPLAFILLYITTSMLSSCTMEEWEEINRNAAIAQQEREARRITYRNILVSASDYTMTAHARSTLFSKGFSPVYSGEYGAVLSLELLNVESVASTSSAIAHKASFTAGTPASKSGYKARVKATVTDSYTGRSLWSSTSTSSTSAYNNRQDAINAACTSALKSLPEYRNIIW